MLVQEPVERRRLGDRERARLGDREKGRLGDWETGRKGARRFASRLRRFSASGVATSLHHGVALHVLKAFSD
jgi:hypothetical protein